MLDIIQNNPFRILGVYADASAAEIKRNETKIRRFLEVGKSITFPTDELGNLPAPIRTNESLDKALSSLNLPQEKLYHALFWYSKDNSCRLDQCVDDLISGKIDEAIGKYAILLYNEEILSSSQKIILGNILFGTSEVIEMCVDGLFTIDKSKKMLGLCEIHLQQHDFLTAKNKLIAEPVNTINACISTAKNADKSTPEKCLQVCNQLINSTKQSLMELMVLLGLMDSDYQRIADSLAKQILQYGINYYNDSEEDNKIDKALTVQEYALYIAVGKFTKDRCQQNVDILRKHKEQAGSSKDIETIVNLLQGLDARPNRMSSASDFVDECIPILSRLKVSLGANDELYIKICSAVANNALGFAIKLVNNNTESKSLAESAMVLIAKIEKLDMDIATRNRINTNKNTLTMNIIRMPSGFEKANSETGGCLGSLVSYIIWFAILGAIAGLAQLCS